MTITKDNIRRILISKGRLLVKEKGADYLTARKLAEASAYSVGTIYNQFGTMDNFVLEQNKQTLDELVRYMLKTPKGESSYQMLNRYLDAFVAFVLANRNLWFLLYNFHLHAEYGKLPKAYLRKLESQRAAAGAPGAVADAVFNEFVFNDQRLGQFQQN